MRRHQGPLRLARQVFSPVRYMQMVGRGLRGEKNGGKAKAEATLRQFVAEEEEALGRRIPLAVVFTMTRAVRSTQHKGIEASLRAQGVDLIEPSLMERAAFSALFEFGGDLRTIPAQGRMEGAIENARLYDVAVQWRDRAQVAGSPRRW